MSNRQKVKAVGFGIYRDGKSFRLQVTGRDGKRRVLRLRSFGIDKKERAADIAVRMERLLAIRDIAAVPDEGTLAAIRAFHPRIREFLDSAGLIPPEAEERTVHECLDAFLAYKSSQCKPSSMLVLGRAAKHAKAYFPADKELQAVSALDVTGFNGWLRQQRGKQSSRMAEATVRKTCSVLCQSFRFAQRSGWIQSNPVVSADVKRSVSSNPARVKDVSLDDTKRLLAACADREETLMVAFGRYAALRIPSEIAEMRWSDFKHDFGIVVVHGTKTGSIRKVPVMPSLRDLLLSGGVPSDLSQYVFPRLRRYPSLSTAMRRIIKRSGVEDYPCALHSLRKSCITDWLKQYPDRGIPEIASWAGHCIAVMTKHYLHVQSEDSALLAARDAQADAERGAAGGAGAVKAA
jgi:integrase